MDFYKDIVQIAKDLLDHYEVGYADLIDDRSILERCANVQLKLIKTMPRRVVRSTLFAGLSEPGILKSLHTIENKFRNGDDVNPHLSRGIFREDYTDYLFFDWGIYHLHLNDTLDGKYFIERSDSLLFIMLSHEVVYFIDVCPHREQFVFAQKELLRIVHDEWPHIIEPFRLKGVTGLSNEMDDPESIAKMRKAGVNVIHRIENDFFAPMGGGITTAATSAEVTLQVDNLYRMAKCATEHINKNKTEIEKRITEATGKPCNSADFHLELTEKGFFVLDRTSQCGFPIKA